MRKPMLLALVVLLVFVMVPLPASANGAPLGGCPGPASDPVPLPGEPLHNPIVWALQSVTSFPEGAEFDDNGDSFVCLLAPAYSRSKEVFIDNFRPLPGP